MGCHSTKPIRKDQALSDLRPRARRAFRILRPALVAIRARKPWRRLRTRFEGWNVRFDMGSLRIQGPARVLRIVEPVESPMKAAIYGLKRGMSTKERRSIRGFYRIGQLFYVCRGKDVEAIGTKSRCNDSLPGPL